MEVEGRWQLWGGKRGLIDRGKRESWTLSKMTLHCNPTYRALQYPTAHKRADWHSIPVWGDLRPNDDDLNTRKGT